MDYNHNNNGVPESNQNFNRFPFYSTTPQSTLQSSSSSLSQVSNEPPPQSPPPQQQQGTTNPSSSTSTTTVSTTPNTNDLNHLMNQMSFNPNNQSTQQPQSNHQPHPHHHPTTSSQQPSNFMYQQQSHPSSQHHHSQPHPHHQPPPSSSIHYHQPQPQQQQPQLSPHHSQQHHLQPLQLPQQHHHQQQQQQQPHHHQLQQHPSLHHSSSTTPSSSSASSNNLSTPSPYSALLTAPTPPPNRNPPAADRNDANANLYVRNLPSFWTVHDLTEFYSHFGGEVCSACILTDPATKKSKCVGFVRFATTQQAQHAVDATNGVHVQSGGPLVARFAHVKSREEKSHERQIKKLQFEHMTTGSVPEHLPHELLEQVQRPIPHFKQTLTLDQQQLLLPPSSRDSHTSINSLPLIGPQPNSPMGTHTLLPTGESILNGNNSSHDLSLTQTHSHHGNNGTYTPNSLTNSIYTQQQLQQQQQQQHHHQQQSPQVQNINGQFSPLSQNQSAFLSSPQQQSNQGLYSVHQSQQQQQPHHHPQQQQQQQQQHGNNQTHRAQSGQFYPQNALTSPSPLGNSSSIQQYPPSHHSSSSPSTITQSQFNKEANASGTTPSPSSNQQYQLLQLAQIQQQQQQQQQHLQQQLQQQNTKNVKSSSFNGPFNPIQSSSLQGLHPIHQQPSLAPHHRQTQQRLLQSIQHFTLPACTLVLLNLSSNDSQTALNAAMNYGPVKSIHFKPMLMSTQQLILGNNNNNNNNNNNVPNLDRSASTGSNGTVSQNLSTNALSSPSLSSQSSTTYSNNGSKNNSSSYMAYITFYDSNPAFSMAIHFDLITTPWSKGPLSTELIVETSIPQDALLSYVFESNLPINPTTPLPNTLTLPNTITNPNQ